MIGISSSSIITFLLLLLTTTVTTNAILIGDEQYGKIEGGVFWIFHAKGGVSVINPETCQVEHTFWQDSMGNPLPQDWSKGVYMQVQQDDGSEQSAASNAFDDDTPLTTTPELLPKTDAYILINSASQEGEVIVMSTTSSHKRPVVDRIPIGSSGKQKLGNAFAVHNRNQFWTHSDSEGYFYVIDITKISKQQQQAGQSTTTTTTTTPTTTPTKPHPIKVKMSEPTPPYADEGHLLWEIGIDDYTLTAATDHNIGYAISSNAPHLYILDMLYHKQISQHDFSKDISSNNTTTSSCGGAISMAYSKLNQHLYIECTTTSADEPTGGILEYDVSIPKSPLFIAQHVHISGTLLETPDQSYVTATDKRTSKMHFFRPSKTTGTKSTTPYTIKVEGHPEPPAFYHHPETFDYIACSPLTTNTNQYHLEPLANAANNNERIRCDYWNNCGPAQTPDDVQFGQCLWDSDFDEFVPLLKATKDQLQDVQNQQEPFGQACSACSTPDAFDNNKEECICTPTCGSCVGVGDDNDGYPNRIDDPILQQTGVMCVDLKDVLLGVVRSADLIPGAGAIKQTQHTAPATATGYGGKQCGMNIEPKRSHKLGGNVYDASISTVPTNELIVVDMRVQAIKCRIELSSEPQQVIYVPTTYHYKSNTGSSGGGLNSTLITIVIVFVVVGTLLSLYIFRKGTRSGGRSIQRQQRQYNLGDLELQDGSSSNHNNTATTTEAGGAGGGIGKKSNNSFGEDEEKKDDHGSSIPNNNFTIAEDYDVDNVVSPPSRIIAAAAAAQTDVDGGEPSVHSGTMA